mmetsp:Transcript_31099/g.95150  ORF Transcript_31099/g.95150 Transcript_31099/m.95150 type:complete len:110 (+) Transcript_31099:97-426(+)|eukprot:scaffold40419_cov36-Tisochrysis_lutea.AAC.3
MSHRFVCHNAVGVPRPSRHKCALRKDGGQNRKHDSFKTKRKTGGANAMTRDRALRARQGRVTSDARVRRHPSRSSAIRPARARSRLTSRPEAGAQWGAFYSMLARLSST